MLLSELAEKELIQVKDGARYGKLADTELLFNPENGKIEGFEVFQKQDHFFKAISLARKKNLLHGKKLFLLEKIEFYLMKQTMKLEIVNIREKNVQL